MLFGDLESNEEICQLRENIERDIGALQERQDELGEGWRGDDEQLAEKIERQIVYHYSVLKKLQDFCNHDNERPVEWRPCQYCLYPLKEFGAK